MLISGRSWILIQCNLHVISGLVLNKLRYFVVSLLDINRLALVCEDSKDPLSGRCVILRELRNSLVKSDIARPFINMNYHLPNVRQIDLHLENSLTFQLMMELAYILNIYLVEYLFQNNQVLFIVDDTEITYFDKIQNYLPSTHGFLWFPTNVS